MSFWRSRRALLACAAAVIVILLLWRPGADRLRSRLEQSLGSALGRKVEIGNVSLQILPRPGFILSQFTVRDDARFSPEPLLRADEVSATLHPSSVWRWRIEIATLSFKDASLNLVRRADGLWNLAPILERAAHTPAAPTGTVRAETRPRFPYIEVSNGRVNLKLGAEKTPYALTDADLALWLQSNDEWGVRLRGQPVRTDMRLSDTGILRANGSWRRANELPKTPLQLTVRYEGAQLGQLTKLFYGADKGWRGTVTVAANLSGSAEELQIQSEATVENFRRYDIVMTPSLSLSANCAGRLQRLQRKISDLQCSSPAQDSALLLRGAVVFSRPAAYDLNLTTAKFPAQRLVDVLHGVKKGLPDDLAATGTVTTDLSFHADGAGGSDWAGSGTTDRLVLRTDALQTKEGFATLRLGTVPFRAITAPPASTRPNAAKAQNTKAQNATAPPPGNSLEVGPLTVDLAKIDLPKEDLAKIGIPKEQPADFHAWFSGTGYNVTLSGEGTVQRLLQIARAAAVTAIHPALEGNVTFDWKAEGNWTGFASPQTTGTIHLRDARAEIPGLNAPLEIAAADIALTPDSFSLQKLSATTAGIHWTGNLNRPRVCAAACTTTVDLHADEISIARLNPLLNPNIQKRSWYRILTGSVQPADSVLLKLNVQGTLQADRLLMGDLQADTVKADLHLENGLLHLSNLRASVLGGKHIGDWHADFAKAAPEFTLTGALESVSLPQLGKWMRNNWIAGNARGSYELSCNGWNAAELQSSSRASMTLIASDGALTRFGPGAGPFKFQGMRATLTAADSLFVVSSGKLENAQGIYEISGVASFAHKLDLKFLRTGGLGVAVTGTLDAPHVETLTGEDVQARAKPH